MTSPAGGDRLRELRRGCGLSLKELGLRTGLSVSYLSEIERGSKTPAYEAVVGLAAALNADPDELCAGFRIVPPDVAELVTRTVDNIRETRALLAEGE